MMRWLNWAMLALKQVWRMRLRSLLTVLGVATGMGLFTMIKTVQQATAKQAPTSQ